jgi:integral membrane protein
MSTPSSALYKKASKIQRPDKTNYIIELFRWCAWLEGTSFLLLLGVAMPLKYIWHYQEAVKFTGMAHGVLFVAYIVAVLLVAKMHRWNLPRIFLVLGASVIPGAPFLVEKYVLAAETTK